MPFGAELRENGRTRFAMWAPRAQRVELVLGSDPKCTRHELTRKHGWFEIELADAPAGTRYAYSVDGGEAVPDPASRANPDDVHAPSMVVDATAYDWTDGDWHGRPWHEAIVYELHVGTFTPEGTFGAASARLDHLVSLGITAIELMPVADFAGTRNWGYDGVLLYAPDARYGTPDDLKHLIDAAHRAGLMVLLDVVYNHFGPEGNYLPQIAPDFFNPAHRTPWGAAINYDGPENATVREFFIHNALYWLEEFHVDGLRLDAVHAIVDTSTPHIVEELATRVHERFRGERHVHLVLENDDNAAHLLARSGHGAVQRATAQWNDDLHHAMHIALTGERDGYYVDYANRPALQIGRCLAEGFAYQGDWSAFRQRMRGEPSADLPPEAFVNFLQNHDQVGNRAFGERIAALVRPDALRAAVACLLLSPAVPLLFMGEEFGASSPFQFFCDFSGDLSRAVTQGRRGEFARFESFTDPAVRERIPDPNAPETFERSRLRWEEIDLSPHREWLDFYRRCLALRRDVLVPHLAGTKGRSGRYDVRDGEVVSLRWDLASDVRWHLDANLSEATARITPPEGRVVFECGAEGVRSADTLPPWGVRVSMREPRSGA